MIQLSIDFLTKENDVPWQIPLISEILIQCRSPPPEQCWTSAVMLDREAHFGKGYENINKKQDRRKISPPRSRVLPLIVDLP